MESETVYADPRHYYGYLGWYYFKLECISANQGEPLVAAGSMAGEAFLNICRRISGESVPFMDLDPHRGILVRISGFLKRA